MTRTLEQVYPPIGEISKEYCQHLLAGQHDHRCPNCKGTLRRCCQSVIGHDHGPNCHTRNR